MFRELTFKSVFAKNNHQNAAKDNRAEEKTHKKENRNGEKQCDAKQLQTK